MGCTGCCTFSLLGPNNFHKWMNIYVYSSCLFLFIILIMWHILLKKAARHPETVYQIVNSKLERVNPSASLNFSKVFHKLFPADEQFHPNMQSFLSIFSDFRIHRETPEKEMEDKKLLPTELDKDITQEIFKKLKIPNSAESCSVSEYNNVYTLLTCLVQLHRKILDSPGNKTENFHNIFEFMNGFPIENTRVVIIGHDPAPWRESSGYAFHGSICASTKNIIAHLNKELKLVGNFLGDEESIVISGENLQEYFKDCQLNGWIQQGVLLFNSCLTIRHKLWKYISGFIIKHLSCTLPHLVFILAGDMCQQEWIIDN